MRRLVLAAEASAAGRGGQAAQTELLAGRFAAAYGSFVGAAKGRNGGGRKRTEHDPSLREDLDRLVEPTSRGDPESPLQERASTGGGIQGHQVSHRMVAELWAIACKPIANPGGDGTINAQFEHLDRAVQLQLSLGEPVTLRGHEKKGPVSQMTSEEIVLMCTIMNEAWVSVGTAYAVESIVGGRTKHSAAS